MWQYICLLFARFDSHDGTITAPPPASTSLPAGATGLRMDIGAEDFGEAGFCRQGVGRVGEGREWRGSGRGGEGKEGRVREGWERGGQEVERQVKEVDGVTPAPGHT